PHRGFARRTAPAAARIADAVLVPVAVVGVRGPELRRDVGVVLAARIGVADQQRDRGAGGATLVHPRQDLDLVGLASLRGVARAAGGPAFEVGTEFLRRNLHPRRE